MKTLPRLLLLGLLLLAWAQPPSSLPAQEEEVRTKIAKPLMNWSKPLPTWQRSLSKDERLNTGTDLEGLVDLELKLEWPQDASEVATSLIFDLGTGDTFTAEIKRTKEGKGTSINLFADFGLFFKTHKPLAKVELAEAPANGIWKFHYRFGMLTVENPTGVVAEGFAGNPLGEHSTSNTVAVIGLLLRQSSGTITVSDAKVVGRTAKLASDQLGLAVKVIGDSVQMKQLFFAGKLAESLKLAQQLEGKVEQLQFAGSPDQVSAMAHQGLCQYLLSQDDAAVTTFTNCWEICRIVLGARHPHTLLVETQLAQCFHKAGNYVRASQHLHHCDAAMRVVAGKHPNAIRMRHNLACCLLRQGQLLEADRLFVECIAGLRPMAASQHELAMALSNSALCRYELLGRYPSAANGQEAVATVESDLQKIVELLQQTLAILEKSKTTQAGLLEAITQGSFPSAGGENLVVFSKANLATALTLLGKFDEVDQLLAGLPPTQSPEINAVLENVRGSARLLRGDFKQARSHFAQALQAASAHAGADQPDTLTCQSNLGCAQLLAGDRAGAIETWQANAAAIDRARILIAATGWERSTFASSLSPHEVLAVLHAQQNQPEEAWKYWEANLGRGLLDDIQATDLQLSIAPETLRTKRRLQEIDQQLRTAAGAKEEDRTKLKAEQEELRAALAARIATPASKSLTLAEIQAQMTPGTALVGWIDLRFAPVVRSDFDQSWGVVVPKTGTPQWIKLPPPEDAAEFRLRSNIQAASSLEKVEADLATIRRQRWLPLQAALKGTDRVVVLTSRCLEGIPLELVVGETQSLTYSPSATIYARLRERSAMAEPDSLLAIGSHDFGARADLPALPSARLEVAGIGRLFAAAQRVEQVEESAKLGFLRELAGSGKLKSFGYLHFATHSAYQRGPFHSALFLSPEGKPATGGAAAGSLPEQDCLLALEVLKSWQLNARCTTLSACETNASSDYIRGEGNLGLPYAFLAAGSRNVVVTRWKIADRPSMLLMVRFYENLLGQFADPRRIAGREFKNGMKMPVQFALSESQSWLRTATDEVIDESSAFRSLGLKRNNVASAGPRYAAPLYWAGFMVIGDGE